MPQLLSSRDFQKMPWKNGGGITTELFRIKSETRPDEFVFRLSQATVNADGPFSLFPNIDRILLILKGEGCVLHLKDREISLTNKFIPVSFAGEESIHCTLKNGEVLDFNVMTNRHWGNSHLEIIETDGRIVCLEDYLFVYDLKEESLAVLVQGESWELKNPNHKKIVIRVRKII